MTRRESNKETAMNKSRANAPTTMSHWARAVRAVLGLACVLGAGLALTATPVAAKVIHKQEGSFKGSDRPEGQPFTGLSMSSAATDQSSGDVYVLEANVRGVFGHSVVDKFDASGKYAGVQITGSQTPQGSFAFGGGLLYYYGYSSTKGISGVAVDNTAMGPNKGDVYVADTGNGVIDRFSSSGTFECQITAREPASRSVEETAHECNGAAGSEVTGTSSIQPTGLAVASNGNVYVADQLHNVIDIFEPSGHYKEQITSSQLGGVAGITSIALDSTADLYVTNYFDDVARFNSSGQFVEALDQGGSPWAVSVDPTNDHLYVTGEQENPVNHEREQAISEYDTSVAGGVFVDSFGYTSNRYPALAVGPTGKVYAGVFLFSPSETEVSIYSADIVLPNITTSAATSVEESTATLHGNVDPDAAHNGPEATSCQFEYGPTKAYGFTAPCTPGPGYSAPTDVSAPIDELQSKSTYHFRLEAANANGASYGEDEVLTTRGAPTVDREAAEALQTTVNFRAHINPWGHDTTCQLQYVTDADFNRSKWANATTKPCSPEDIGSDFGDVLVKLKVEGLQRQTGYHYRFLATNQAGLAGHPPDTFETYGIREYTIQDLNAAGEPETQAGAHPYEVLTNVELSKTTMFGSFGWDEEHGNYTGVNTKDIKVDLPPGLIGNPTATPKCNRYLVNQEACPGDTQVGTLELWLDRYLETPSEVLPLPSERAPSYDVPVFNLEPSGRYPAEFGAFIEGQAGAWIAFHVRTGSDYGVSADSLDIVSTAVIERVRVRSWGVPADPSHNAERSCPGVNGYQTGCPDSEPERPLLTNPTSCTGPQASTAMVDSWQQPGEYVMKTAELPGFTGCDKLKFEPTFKAQPTTSVADSPSGLEVDLQVPQPEGCKEHAGKVECEQAEADLRDAKVVLPAGVTVNPSASDGLQACSETQIGYLSQQRAEAGHPQFTSDAAKCPDASKIGTVKIKTPLLEHELEGAVYVAQQDANPFKSLLALYIAVYDPTTGVVLKLPGRVTPDPVTGQLTTTFDENPQLPFEDFTLDFFGANEVAGKSRAALTTPLVCGSYSTSTDLMPWSAPEGQDAILSSPPFTVASAPGGGACVNSEAQAPNTPGFQAGTASPIAASYSPFVLKLAREDASQHFSALDVTLPPGLTGKIAGLEECSQAAIDQATARSHEGEGATEMAHPSCPSGSEVGVVHVGAGSGAPYYQTGHAYFAGPYKGAPFSIVFVTPAVAGPFDLGTVVVRAALFIDPNTAQVTVKSDPFPTILYGIPLDIRSIGVDMSRKEFVLNPTSCAVMSVAGHETSTAGATASLSDRFQAGDCTTLPFHPVFLASTSGMTSRKVGASLAVRIASSTGQANIAKVHVTLPRQLPSRVETLKLACPERVFAANPASCPAASAVGRAVAHTPILSSPLSGPVYIVSHGAKFPDVEVVLQGEGVTIILDGKTNIKNGITTSTFESIPDAPVSSFELDLPEGAHSILAAPGGGLCSLAARTVLVKKKVTVTVRVHGHLRKRRVTRKVKKKRVVAGLVMPTTIQGQNGAVIKQNTRIGVTGCTKVTAKAKRHAKHGKRKHGKKNTKHEKRKHGKKNR